MTDTQAFIELVRGLGQGPWQELSSFFESGECVSVARAPGRLDVMGGIADYSGSLVLQLPTQEATYVAAQRTRDEDWQIVSLPQTDDCALRCVRRVQAGQGQR